MTLGENPIEPLSVNDLEIGKNYRIVNGPIKMPIVAWYGPEITVNESAVITRTQEGSLHINGNGLSIVLKPSEYNHVLNGERGQFEEI